MKSSVDTFTMNLEPCQCRAAEFRLHEALVFVIKILDSVGDPVPAVNHDQREKDH